MNRRKMLLSTLGSTLAVNGVSIAAASTPPLLSFIVVFRPNPSLIWV